MANTLLIGRHGQVSTYLQAVLPADSLQIAGSAELDLAHPEHIAAFLNEARPSLIINPAAYTAVDLAEEEQDLAYAINRDAPAKIAQWCAENDVPLIHFSTDYVFDGEANSPYTETDLPSPTGVYGASKLAGERAIQQTDAAALILRTSWVYSNHGKNFYKTMLSLAATRDELSVVADQMGSPTFAGSIASVGVQLADQILQAPELAREHQGLYHFSCGGETSWHGFAAALFAANGVDHLSLNEIGTAEYPTPAKRPAYSVLNNSKLHDVFGLSLPSWQDALESCVQEAKV